MKVQQQFRAVCFGEVIFDVFHGEEKIGGAPLNVACRLNALGLKTEIISRIGKDLRGKELLSFLESGGVGISNIQVDSHLPTGIVNVELDNHGSGIYDILAPAAWDNIEVLPTSLEIVKKSDVFIFGSLACRNDKSRNSLFKLLGSASYKVFDVNLRPPLYEKEILKQLMEAADFIKFNEEELQEISEIFASGSTSIQEKVLFISSTFSTSTICVTRGGKGAVLYREGSWYYHDGYSIKVKDTVGAGDSFLAGLIAKLLQNQPPQEALNFACALGTIVAGSEGANPTISAAQIEDFLAKN